jgi:hypothetical protein
MPSSCRSIRTVKPPISAEAPPGLETTMAHDTVSDRSGDIGVVRCQSVIASAIFAATCSGVMSAVSMTSASSCSHVRAASA